MNPNTMTTEQLGNEIVSLQRIQMLCNPDSIEWEDASADLQPLFVEAAKRAANGESVKTL